MLEQIRLSLRLTNGTFDNEINDLIAACKYDLKLAGVVNIQDDDPLILRAATLYCKGHFGFADVGVKFLQSYETLKISLLLAGDYNTAAAGGDPIA